MSKTIKGKIFVAGPDQTALKEIEKYLTRLQMVPDRGISDGDTFLIELKHYPEILSNLEAAGYFVSNGENNWDITGISESGITLYLAHQYAGDGCVFIPHENIIAIHTVEEDFLGKIREFVSEITSVKRKENG